MSNAYLANVNSADALDHARAFRVVGKTVLPKLRDQREAARLRFESAAAEMARLDFEIEALVTYLATGERVPQGEDAPA